MGVAIEDPCLEASLKEVSNPTETPVEAHGMEAVQPLHPSGELGLRRDDDKVEVIWHQRPDEHLPIEAQRDLAELPLPPLAVQLVEHNRLPRDPARRDVVDRRGRQVGPSSSCHLRRP